MLFQMHHFRLTVYCRRVADARLRGHRTQASCRIVFIIMMFPPMKWGDILILALLSVCLSICLSHFCVCSMTFEPLVGFSNNCTNVKYDKAMCSAYV